MKLVDKIKNMFTEEVEEEKPVIKKEVMHVEINTPKQEEIEEVETFEEPVKEEKPAPIFFDDKDFDVLEKPKIEKVEKVQEEETFKDKYKGKKQLEEQKPKIFKPSPIITPVYGILDKDYTTDESETKKIVPMTVHYEHKELTVDDIRRKAFGTLEDDIETTLFGKEEIPPMHEKKEEPDQEEVTGEIIDEPTVEEEKKRDDLENFDDFEYEKEKSSLEDDFDLSDNIMNNYDETEKTNDESISDSDLFDLIDSMYDEGDKK